MPGTFTTKFLAYLLAAGFLLAGQLAGQVLLYFPALALITAASWKPWDEPRFLRQLLVGLPLVLVCLVLAPDLSTDHHRYLWEGYVQGQGFSPYQHAPLSLFDRLNHPSEGQINHPDLAAIYPPLAQYLFQLSTFLGTSVYAWKGMILLCLAGLWCFASERDGTGWWLLTPPLLLEGLWNGHLDAVGIIPAAVMISAIERKRAASAGVALGAMISIKLLPLLLLPAALLALPKTQRLRFLAALSVTLVLVYLPYLSQLPELFHSFRTFAGNWSFNNPLFHLLCEVAPVDWVRPLMAGCLLLTSALILLPQRSVRWRCTATWLALSAFSPTLYPWYLLWLLPFASVGKRGWASLIYSISFLSYLVLVKFRAEGVWQEAWWWMAPEWLLLFFCSYRLLAQPAQEASE